MRIIEELINYKPGDVASLKYGTFIKSPGKEIVSSHHLFVVVDSENVCEISSKNNKVGDNFPYNVELKSWSSAGLVKPCHVKTDCYGEVDDCSVFKLIGHLSEEDQKNVLASYQNSPQNYILEWIDSKD